MKILAILADGSEELEAVAVIDILRRCGINVTTAALFNENITGAHGTKLVCDTTLNKLSAREFDAVFLPGGLQGSLAFYDSETVLSLVREMAADGKVVSAICAAPIVLAKAGLLQDGRFTLYPGFESYLNGMKSTGMSAETDGKIVTGKGPGAVFDFSQQLAGALGAEKEFSAVADGMFLPL